MIRFGQGFCKREGGVGDGMGVGEEDKDEGPQIARFRLSGVT